MIHFARILISSLFILGGINKIINYGSVLDSMLLAGLPIVNVLLPLTILLEIACGVILAIGLRFHVHAAFALAIFTTVTNFVFHDFWGMEGPERAIEISLFFKNVVVIGALLHVTAIGMATRDIGDDIES